MRMRPARLNAAIAWLFAIGSACFVLGSVPAYANAVGGAADSVTFFVGSIWFTSASLLQLLQAQTPAMTDADAATEQTRSRLVVWAWLPHDRGWLAAVTQFPGTLFFNVSTFAALAHNATVQHQNQHVWRPDIYGSTLFLVASAFALAALATVPRGGVRPWLAGIGWVNMVGSVLFMASAIGSFVLPSTGDLVDQPLAVGGTLLGAACFLLGALLMFPAWRAAVGTATGTTQIRPSGGSASM
jgi:hypothetical protein